MPKRTTRYRAIQALMVSQGVSSEELADAIGMKYPTLRGKMRGELRWILDDVFAICEYMGIPDENIAKYFRETSADAKEKLSTSPIRGIDHAEPLTYFPQSGKSRRRGKKEALR